MKIVLNEIMKMKIVGKAKKKGEKYAFYYFIEMENLHIM
jgi:hypothetical protein